ncbi:DUF1254 domain-containing protein [Sphingomonas bacterium]|uniref:DUF1254 domain-containing protein n=1 Tax=Sphingomonas bacterium TaxID=1895847 RepID=UPI0020C61165|nr:DUF1254 domain-containing protein [Sphingomonas bacterium]
MIPRRHFLAGSGLAAASALLGARPAWADDRAALAEEAFLWGVPLVLTGRYLKIAADAGLAFNRFYLSPDLATPQTRALGPQVDTLYGLGWIDLADGPQVISVPDTHDRYYSIQLLDAYADSFAYIGRRATGTKAGAYALTPPGYRGRLPAGVTEIKAPTSKVLAAVRTLVRSKADLPAARAIHGAYTLGPLSGYPKAQQPGVFRAESLNILPVVDLSKAGIGYFEELNRLVADYPPLAYDAPRLARFGSLGIGPGRQLSSDPAIIAALTAAIPAGLARIRMPKTNWTANGWSTRLDVTPFIQDPVARAATNLYGPGTQIAEEALYLSAQKGPDGEPLSGARRYSLRFPKGQLPPAGAFWSVGLYTKDIFLYDNEIDRYSITDRTDGLHFASDGSLTILIQHDRPADPNANWLPAPADHFLLTIRAYQPKPALLARQYQLPPLSLVA